MTPESAGDMRFLGIVVRMTPERRREVYQNIEEISAPTRSFYVMVAISTTIATYGLLANSTAVVIGAMLVAPLMGPIFGIALSLSTGDRNLFPKAVISELAGVLLAVLLGVLIGLIPLRLGFGSEILARTQPTLYDVIVALASGLAGAYALVDEKISPALPGVAISTALVPPLAACGLCLATGRGDWAFGAFLLFLANFLAIQIAAAFVFSAFGMVGVRTQEPFNLGRFCRRFALSLALLAIVAVFMTHTLVQMVAESRFSRALERSLAQKLRSTVGAQLTSVRVEPHASVRQVIATVLTPQEIDSGQVARIEKSLRESVAPNIHLIVRSLLSKDADRSGPVFLADDERERRAEVNELTQFLSRSSQALREQLANVPGATLIDVARSEENGQTVVTAVVRTPTPIEPTQVVSIQKAMTQALGNPIRLVVRSILTRDADSQRYLYEPKKETKPLTGEALKFHRRLEAALKNQIRQQQPGASLQEFRYRGVEGRLLILAVARTPQSIEPQQVKQVEAALRRYVHPKVELIVRSVVGADTSANYYLSDFDESKLAPDASDNREMEE